MPGRSSSSSTTRARSRRARSACSPRRRSSAATWRACWPARACAASRRRPARTAPPPSGSPTTSASRAPLPQPRVDVLAKLVRDEGFDTVLFAQSVLAADVAAGLAARLDAGLNWDLVDLTADGVGKRPALADSVVVDVGWSSDARWRSSAPARSMRSRPAEQLRSRTRRSSSRTSHPRARWSSRRTR